MTTALPSPVPAQSQPSPAPSRLWYHLCKTNPDAAALIDAVLSVLSIAESGYATALL
jgi:hypothetical protein